MESLIGVLLMSIIGLGVTYATSRVLVTQRDMNLQHLAVAQMRNLLQQYGASLCPTAINSSKARLTLPNQLAEAPLTLDVSCSNVAGITIQGIAVAADNPLQTVVLTTRETDRSLFGGIIRVGDET